VSQCVLVAVAQVCFPTVCLPLCHWEHLRGILSLRLFSAARTTVTDLLAVVARDTETPRRTETCLSVLVCGKLKLLSN
jgi:hypothetical protein